MKCTIRGEKIKITNAINDYIEDKLSILDKYFKRDANGEIIEEEGYDQKDINQMLKALRINLFLNVASHL